MSHNFDSIQTVLGMPDELTTAMNELLPEQGCFGPGSDGDGSLVLAASPYTLTRDYYYRNLSIADGVVVNTGSFKIFVQDTLTGGATCYIQNNGVAAAGAVAGTAVAPGTLGGSGAGGAGNAGGGAGTAGSASAVCIASTGGAGGAGTGGAGGAAGAATAPNGTYLAMQNIGNALAGIAVNSSNAIALATAGSGGGGGGGGGGGEAGGGGGSGGGIVFVAARNWNYSGTLKAIGGAGANSVHANGGGGGGGGGGCVIRIYRDAQAAPTVTVTGGTAGTGNVAGTAGTLGKSIAIAA